MKLVKSTLLVLALCCFQGIAFGQCEGDTTPPVITVPDDITIDCDEDWPSIPPVICWDDCDLSLIPTFTFWYVDNKCGFQSQILLWSATDQAGNSTSETMVVMKCDLSAPVFDMCPEDLDLECGDEIPGPPEMSATDNCSDFNIAYMETVEDLGTCPGEVLITRTWTATDEYNNSSTCTQTITITDNTAPTIDSYNDGEALVDITVSCDAIPDQYTANVSDNCDANPDVIFTEKIIPGSCQDSYTIYRSYLAVDDCGNTSALDEHNITVIDDEAPELLFSPGSFQVQCENEISGAVSASNIASFLGVSISDLNAITSGGAATQGSAIKQLITVEAGDQISFDYNFNSNEGPNQGTFNDFAFVVLVDDGNVLLADTFDPDNVWMSFNHTFGSSGTCILAFCVMDAGDTIVDTFLTIDNISNSSVTDGSFESGSLANWDSIGAANVTEDNVTDGDFSATLNTGILISGINCELLDLIVDCDEIPDVVDVSASDNCDNDVDIAFEEETTGWNGCEYYIYRTWTATDNCGNSSSHTQTITVQDNFAPVLSATPGDLSLSCDDSVPAPADITATDMCDGTVPVDFDTFTKGDGCDLTIVRTWSASDACGNSTSHTQTITITDTTPPTITHNLDLNIDAECDNIPAAGSISATDNCSGATTSLSEIIFDGECVDSYTIHRIYIAFDACGNSSSVTQTINVSDNTPPTFDELPQNQFIDCPAQGGGTPDNITASDNCDDDVFVSYFDSAYGSCSFTRTWYAQDNCGNTTYASQLLTYNDNTPPVLSGLPENAAVSCDDIPEPAEVTASDECSSAFLAFDEKVLPGSCPNEYTLLRTWTGLDACGNTSTHTQVIEVSDNEAPTLLSAQPSDLIVECGDEIPPYNPEWTDNCGSVTEFLSSGIGLDGCYEIIYETYGAGDGCGNTSSVSRTITIIDTTAPSLEVGADLIIECDEPIPAAEYEASDICDDDVLVVIDEEIIEGECPQSYAIQRTYTAYDDCGNTTTKEQTITVEDTTAPVFSNTPEDMEILYCNEPWPEPQSPTVTDNCDAQPTLTFQQEILTDQEVATGVNGDILTRIWTTTDNCGNTDTFTQTIYLIDDCPSNGCVSLYNFHDAPESVTIDMLPNKVKFNWNVPENAIKAQAKITSALGTNWYLIHNLNFPKIVNHNFFVAGIEYTVEIRYFSSYNPCKVSSKWSDGVTFIIPGSQAMAQNEGNPFDDEKEVKSTPENSDNHLHIYPNPNNGEFFIVTDLRDYSIEIFDLSGRLVTNLGEFNNEQSHIELDSYTPGIYMVRIFNDSKTLTERVILK